MKHNIKINGEVKEIDCELGSGILDKYGREIFEGDTIQLPDGARSKIFFREGAFWQDGDECILYPINEFEVID